MTCAARGQVHPELWIGHDGAGTLAWLKTFAEPLILDRDFTPFIPGVAGVPIGMSNIPEDRPGVLMLPGNVNIGFVLGATTPGLTMYNGPTAMNAGDVMMLGPPFFDFHPVWTIQNGDPGAGAVYKPAGGWPRK